MSWHVAPLSSASKTFADGDWIESKDQSSDGIRLVQTGNIGEGHFKDRRDKARFISPETFDRLNCTEVLPGDVLISRLPDPVGRSCQIPDTGDKMITAVDCTIVRPDTDKLDQDYLVYYTQSKAYQRDIEDRCTGTTRKRISRKNLGLIPIPLPPLEEQKRIVSVLDQAFAALDRARANAEANLADAEELYATTKTEILATATLDAPEVDLATVAAITTKLTDPKLPENQELPHVGAGNMITDSDELVDVLTAKEEGLKSGKFPFASDVVLYSKIRPYLKKVARPDFDGLCSADVYPLTPSDQIDRDYLFHLLLSDDFTEYAIKGSARAGMPKVNQTHLFAYRFGLPALKAQRAAVAKIDMALRQASRLKLTFENKLNDLEDLRQSILQKAFAGDLT